LPPKVLALKAKKLNPRLPVIDYFGGFDYFIKKHLI